MTAAPACADCAHLQGTATCGRPVASYWNSATNQRRSRVAAPITAERSDRKVYGRMRERCGPDALFFAPHWPEVRGPSRQHDTVADSDGDDGA